MQPPQGSEARRVYDIAKTFVEHQELTIEAVGVLVLIVESHAVQRRDKEMQAILLKHMGNATSMEALNAVKAIADDFCKPSVPPPPPEKT